MSGYVVSMVKLAQVKSEHRVIFRSTIWVRVCVCVCVCKARGSVPHLSLSLSVFSGSWFPADQLYHSSVCVCVCVCVCVRVCAGVCVHLSSLSVFAGSWFPADQLYHSVCVCVCVCMCAICFGLLKTRYKINPKELKNPLPSSCWNKAALTRVR